MRIETCMGYDFISCWPITIVIMGKEIAYLRVSQKKKYTFEMAAE